MPRFVFLLSLGTLAAAPLALAAQASAPAERARFVIRRGADTVATEEFARTPTTLDGTLIVHAKSRTFERYHAVIAPDATLPLIEVTVRREEGSDTGAVRARVAQQTRVIFRDDSVAVDDQTHVHLLTLVFPTERGAVPYLNLSFGLMEQAIRRARATGAGSAEVAFFNLSGGARQGGQTVRGTVTPLAGDSVSVMLGSVEFRFLVDRQGRLLGGGIPAQGLSVLRADGS